MKWYHLITVCIVLLGIAGCSPKQPPGSTPKSKEDPRLNLQRGALYLSEQKCQEAATEYSLYLSKVKNSPEAHNYLGLAYFCLKDYPNAKANFEKAIAIDPLYAQVHNNLGILYMEMNDLQQAEKEFLAVLSDKKTNPVATYYNLAQLYMKKGELESALYTVKKCVQFQPDEIAPRLFYASLLDQMKRTDEAIIEYKSILQKNPNSQEANFYLANLLAVRQKDCEAKAYYSKALEINPTNDFGLDAINKMKNLHCDEQVPLQPLPVQK